MSERPTPAGFPIPSQDLLDITEKARPQGLPCTGDRRCLAWTHKPSCVISIAEQLQRERRGGSHE